MRRWSERAKGSEWVKGRKGESERMGEGASGRKGTGDERREMSMEKITI